MNDPIGLIKVIGFQIKGWGLLIFLARIVWIVITLLFFIGVWKCFWRGKMSTTMLMAIILVVYFALTTGINGLGVNARFKVPVEVFIFSFALCGLFSLKRDTSSDIQSQ
jgi:hypothetical protein